MILILGKKISLENQSVRFKMYSVYIVLYLQIWAYVWKQNDEYGEVLADVTC